jgi:uncharacterized membrane protein
MAIEQPNSRQEISEGAFLAAVGYFGPLCLLTILLQPNNKYTKYHARQGLVLFVAEVALAVGGVILFWLTHFIFGVILIHIPVLGDFLNFIINVLVKWVFWGAFAVGCFAFTVIGAYNAWGGVLWQMPLLWYYARRLKL